MSRKPDKKTNTEGTDRRDFLKLAGLGSVAGGVALVAGNDKAEAVETSGSRRGYQETDHVKTYYNLARF